MPPERVFGKTRKNICIAKHAASGQVNTRLRVQTPTRAPEAQPTSQAHVQHLPPQQPLFSPNPDGHTQKPTNFPRFHHPSSRPRPPTNSYVPATLSSHQTPATVPDLPSHENRDGVPAEQQPDRHPQRNHLPPLRTHPRRRHLAGHARRRHRVRALPLGAAHRAGRLPHGGVHGGARRSLLPRHLAPLGLPPRHVRPHRRALLLHRLRVRRHQQGGRGGGVRPRVQGVQAWGLQHLAAEEGREQQELEQDQELPPGCQGLQEPAGQEQDVAAVRLLRPLTHRVWLLQAPTSCGYTYVSGTEWTTTAAANSTDPDCQTWSNDATGLCYGCQSCKAGVVATFKRDWKRVAIVSIVFLVFIVIVYSVGCCAFRNNRRDNAYHGGWKGGRGYA